MKLSQLSKGLPKPYAVGASAAAYLLALRRLGGADSAVRTGAIAADLGVRPPSVVVGLNRLKREGMVSIAPRRGALLTSVGSEIARHLWRRHALTEVLLHRVLKVDWDQLHEEATRLQSTLSERMESAFTNLLHDAHETPYGQLIPPEDRDLPARMLVRLAEVQVGEVIAVREVDDLDPNRLREYLAACLVPGKNARVTGRLANGMLRVRVGTIETEIGPASAGGVFGERIPTL